MGQGENREGMDVKVAMDMMFDSIMSVNLGNIRLENDIELCRNAEELEKLSAKIAAFDRLCSDEKYLSSFNDDDRAIMEDKLNRIRSVAYYYEARKELITDKYYASYYNDELTMDVTSTNDNDQREVALKLLKAYAAGKHMMQQNGMSQKKINALGTPKFMRAVEGEQYLKMCEEPLKLGKTKELLSEYYLNRRDLSRSEYVRLNNKKSAEAINATALSNAMNYKGDIEKQPGYKEPEYDASKMSGLVNELERRRKEYNRNAIMQDCIGKQAVESRFRVNPTDTVFEYLKKTTGKKAVHGRTFGAMTDGKSAEEVKRLFELMTGTDEQQLEYETELINQVMGCDINMYDASDFGKLVDNFVEKERLSRLASDGLRDSLKHVKELVEKSDGL